MRYLIIFLFGLLLSSLALSKTVSYELELAEIQANFTGNPVTALSINGQIPAPLLEATVGDTLRVTFTNNMHVDASVHWHGVLLPADQDGVPYLNTQPIAAGGRFTYEFPIIHSGTFWYHSHTDLQVQKGLYGPIVFHKTEPAESPIQDEVVVFSDWNDEDAEQVFDNLKKDDDYYAFKKDTVQSWAKVLSYGRQSINNRLDQTRSRMPPMDLADVAYDQFLSNGAPESRIILTRPESQQLRLRLINGSTSSYFDLEYANGPMTIVSADGVDVEPLRVQRLRIATAETYDVLVSTDVARSIELRATSIDGSGYTSLFVGDGQKFYAPDIERPNFYLMTHEGMVMGATSSEHDMSMEHDMPMSPPGGDTTTAHDVHDGQHEMPSATVADNVEPGVQNMPMTHEAMPGGMMEGEVVPHLQDYRQLRALQPTTLPADNEWQNITLTLTGNMERYVWSFDNRSLRGAEPILITPGANIRINLINSTMMHHPLHLHGHYFRMVTAQGEYSPLKHTVDVPPMGAVVIEFEANNDQDWLFHCHNQYHMKSGMNRVLSYADSSNVTEQMYQDIQPYKRWFRRTDFDGLNNYLFLEASVSDENNQFHLELDADLENEYEATLTYDLHLGNFFSAFVGVEAREHHHSEAETLTVAGFKYMLPFMIESEVRVDDTGETRLELDSELQITKRTLFDWQWNTDSEYRLSLRYSFSKRWGLIFSHDSNYGEGVGFHYLF